MCPTLFRISTASSSAFHPILRATRTGFASEIYVPRCPSIFLPHLLSPTQAFSLRQTNANTSLRKVFTSPVAIRILALTHFPPPSLPPPPLRPRLFSSSSPFLSTSAVPSRYYLFNLFIFAHNSTVPAFRLHRQHKREHRICERKKVFISPITNLSLLLLPLHFLPQSLHLDRLPPPTRFSRLTDLHRRERGLVSKTYSFSTIFLLFSNCRILTKPAFYRSLSSIVIASASRV